MRLRDYLEKYKILQAEFATQVETTPATINRICQGLTVPRRDLMARIIEETQGAVEAGDLIILPNETQKPKGPEM